MNSIKFDADFAIFGIFTASIDDRIPFDSNVVGYTNNACKQLYGNFTGQTILEILTTICNDAHKAAQALQTVQHEKECTIEGKLNGTFVKYHCRLVAYCDTSTSHCNEFIQAGITDISESIIIPVSIRPRESSTPRSNT